jgi:protein SCO1/2
VLLGIALTAPRARAVEAVALEPHLGSTLPLSLPLRGEDGAAATLGERFDRTPIVLVMGYLSCRDLCSMTLAGATEALAASGLEAGRDYGALFVSIDPADSPHAMAVARGDRIPAAQRPAWRFLGGEPASIARLAHAVGFRYVREGSRGYAHPAGLLVAAADGTISRYFPGVRFDARELRLAIVEAGAGRVGGLGDRIALFCRHLDPAAGRHTVDILHALDGLVMAFVAACAFQAWRSARRRKTAA